MDAISPREIRLVEIIPLLNDKLIVVRELWVTVHTHTHTSPAQKVCHLENAFEFFPVFVFFFFFFFFFFFLIAFPFSSFVV